MWCHLGPRSCKSNIWVHNHILLYHPSPNLVWLGLTTDVAVRRGCICAFTPFMTPSTPCLWADKNDNQTLQEWSQAIRVYSYIFSPAMYVCSRLTAKSNRNLFGAISFIRLMSRAVCCSSWAPAKPASPPYSRSSLPASIPYCLPTSLSVAPHHQRWPTPHLRLPSTTSSSRCSSCARCYTSTATSALAHVSLPMALHNAYVLPLPMPPPAVTGGDGLTKGVNAKIRPRCTAIFALKPSQASFSTWMVHLRTQILDLQDRGPKWHHASSLSTDGVLYSNIKNYILLATMYWRWTHCWGMPLWIVDLAHDFIDLHPSCAGASSYCCCSSSYCGSCICFFCAFGHTMKVGTHCSIGRWCQLALAGC